MHDKLKDVMYNMFLDGAFPELHMDEYKVMWEALMELWEIPTPRDWEGFLEDVNCRASNKYDFFTKVFDKYFNNN